MAGKKGVKNVFETAFGKAPEQSTEASWDGSDGALMAKLVALVTDAGGAVLFGKTRDGGALVLSFLHDQIDRKAGKYYYAKAEDVEDGLRHHIEVWEGILEALKAT